MDGVYFACQVCLDLENYSAEMETIACPSAGVENRLAASENGLKPFPELLLIVYSSIHYILGTFQADREQSVPQGVLRH